MKKTFNPFILFLLSIPMNLYRFVVFLRNLCYDRNFFTIFRSECPVISVGNITIGGTGKTPFVAYLCRYFLEKGNTIAIVSRGYGGKKSGSDVLIVSDESGRSLCSAQECGDEPFLLARTLEKVPVLISTKRSRAIEKATQLFDPDIVVLDDGYQHRGVHRDIDILLIDATDPFGNYRLLPSGTLREPIQNLKRAHIIVITRAKKGEEFLTLQRIIKTHNMNALVFQSGHSLLRFVEEGSGTIMLPGELNGKKIFAFCAIGNPDVFTMDLERLGAEIVGHSFFRDHHRYSRDDMKKIKGEAMSAGAQIIVTTHKDIINIGKSGNLRLPLYYAELQTVVHESEQFFSILEEMLAMRRS